MLATCTATLQGRAPVREADAFWFGPYKVIARLGEGGMGVVYLARDTEWRYVALKTLTVRRRCDRRAIERFEREIDLALQFDHPNVVRAIDAGYVGEVPYLVMEYLDGLDLSKLLECRGALAVADACEVARQMALGLEEIHQSGAIHRDIKPANAVLTRQGVVKIVDVGLALVAREVDECAWATTSAHVVGSFDYMAPEQASDSRAVDRSVDLYALGATLYQLLIGEPPFSGSEYNTPVKKLLARQSRPAPSVSARRPEVPSELAALVARLLATNPAERFQSAAPLAAALVPFTGGSSLPELIANTDANRPWQAPMDRLASSTSSDGSSATVEFDWTT
jgi:serine/threonine protein kinase